MKLTDRELDNLLNEEETEEVTARQIKSDELEAASGRVNKIRNAVAARREDNQIYGNKDKTRIKR
jgi:hypothetical protein